MAEPRYPHHCRNCVFLGHVGDGEGYWTDTKYLCDGYWCPGPHEHYMVTLNRTDIVGECVVARGSATDPFAFPVRVISRRYWDRLQDPECALFASQHPDWCDLRSALILATCAGLICKVDAETALAGIPLEAQ